MNLNNKSQYDKWRTGELPLLGSFQTRLFEAFQLADAEHQGKLAEAFRDWFVPESGEERPTAKCANAVVTQLSKDLISAIKGYLDEAGSFDFEYTANLAYALEEMKCIVKKGREYLLMASDNSSGETYRYEIDDAGCISIHDLIWILEQIENSVKQ